jgi:hypothetical protein
MSVGPHASHARPAFPHAPSLSPPSHVPPLQQPLVQLAGSQRHEPPLQNWLESQESHTTPPVPQLVSLVPGTQSLPSQHPGQVDVSQTQLPPEQRWPASQTAPLPQRQVPPLPLPQLSERTGSQVTPPHWQMRAVPSQRSLAPHATHASPPPPHAPFSRPDMQVSP